MASIEPDGLSGEGCAGNRSSLWLCSGLRPDIWSEKQRWDLPVFCPVDSLKSKCDFSKVIVQDRSIYIFQIFQSNTSVCLIISVFCKSCEPICGPEIVLIFAADFQANPTDISCKNTFTFSVQFTNLTIHGNKNCCALEILKIIWTCLAFI